MLNRAVLSLTILGALSLSDVALGRILWDDRLARLNPRRFGMQNPEVTVQIGQACEGQVCGVLGGKSITPLLAVQPECSQQDMADQIIDASKQFDAATAKNMVNLAIQYRQAEKNTPPDFTTNPPTPRNSVFCQKAPKNAELNCLVQAQDPANGDVFFDPATGKSVQRGSQANTIPFCQNNKSANPAAVAPPPGKNSASTPPPPPNNSTGTPPPPPNNSTGTPPPPPAKNATPPPAKNSTGTPPPAKNSTGTPPPPPGKGSKGTPPPNNSTGSPACTPQNANNTTNNTATGNNLQTFAGALGAPAPAVNALSNGQFQVQGNANFKTLQNALTRSCDVQNNKCSDNANSSGNKGPLTVGACGKQRDDCAAIAATAAGST